MICRLMKRDFAWSIVLFSAVLTVPFLRATRPGPPLRSLIIVTPILFLTALARPQQRTTLFEAALPVAARDLFLARLFSLLATVWLPLALYAVVRADWSAGTLEWAALLALLILLPLATRADEFSGPAWVAPVEWFAGLAIGSAGLYFLPAAVFLAIVTLAFAGVFVRTWNTLPQSFQCAPMEAVAVGRIAVSSKETAPSWWILAWRSLSWFTAIYVPLIAAQFLLGNVLLAFLFCGSLYSQTRTRMRWMEALPVARRLFLLFALVPAVLPMIVAAALATPTLEVQVQYRSGTADVRFPLEFWRHAPGGVAPVVEAPWGETYQLVPERFLGYPLYNPYAVGPQSSKRFLVWQHDRAQDAVNAQPFGGLRMRILYTAAISALSLAAVWLIELLYWFRLTRFSTATRSWLALAILAPVFGIPLILEVTGIGHRTGSTSISLLRALIWRIAGRLPDNLAVVLAVAVIPTVFLLWLLDRQIRESEVGTPTLVKLQS